MADKDDEALVEEMLQGKSSVDDENAGSYAPEESAVPDLGIEGMEAEEEKPAEAEDEQPDAKPAKLPWDPVRQQKDQELANFRKRVEQQDHVIEELRGKIAAIENGSPDRDLDATLEALNSLKEPENPGAFASDEEQEAYQESLKKYLGEQKKLTAKVTDLSKKLREAGPAPKASEKPKEKPTASDKPEDESAPTKEQFDAMCREAAIEFGSRLDLVARASIVKELSQLGFGSEKWATAAQLQKIVTRVYRETAERAAAKRAAASAGARETPEASYSPPPRTDGRVTRTIDEVFAAADKKAKQRR